MNAEIGTEAVQFPENEYINGIFVAVQKRILWRNCPWSSKMLKLTGMPWTFPDPELKHQLSVSCNFGSESQNNDWYRGPAELVQYFYVDFTSSPGRWKTYNLHYLAISLAYPRWRKGDYLPSRRLEEGGRGESAPWSQNLALATRYIISVYSRNRTYHKM
jgi:hypothetical protein